MVADSSWGDGSAPRSARSPTSWWPTRTARELIAPNEEVGAYVCETYQFDQVTLSDVHVARTSSKWVIATDRSRLSATFGRRRLLGYPLRLVRGPLIHPVTARLSTPLARRLVEGVQTHGSAGHGAHEYYVAQDLRRVATLSGSWEGEPIGVLAPVTPAPQFGFSSTADSLSDACHHVH